jgi:long-chain acyl-CoA synthetase
MDLISAFLRTTQQQPEAIAIIDGDQRFSWRDLAGRTGQMAGALRQLGVCVDSTVSILSLSSARVFELFYAVPWAGGRVCPLNYRLSTAELMEILADADVEILAVDDAFAETGRTLKSLLPRLSYLLYLGVGEIPEGMIGYERLLAQEDALNFSDCAEENVACLYYTGGTTGKAKGVMLTHRNIFANALNFGLATNLTEQDRVLHCGPMFHVAFGTSWRILNAIECRSYRSFRPC